MQSRMQLHCFTWALVMVTPVFSCPLCSPSFYVSNAIKLYTFFSLLPDDKGRKHHLYLMNATGNITRMASQILWLVFPGNTPIMLEFTWIQTMFLSSLFSPCPLPTRHCLTVQKKKEPNKHSIVPSSTWDHLPTPAYEQSNRSKEYPENVAANFLFYKYCRDLFK